MLVRLRSCSQIVPVAELPEVYPDLKKLIAKMARVSNPANENNEDSDRLIKYLMKHKHWSPFEMVNVCLEIETTRDIARQMLRHRSFSFQEFSQRYAEPKELGKQFVIRETRFQDDTNRQNSIPIDKNVDSDALTDATWKVYQQSIIDMAEEAYGWAIDNGIAKECARVVLPEGNTKSRLYMNGSIRSWLHYLDIRMAEGTQHEHREIAVRVSQAIGKVFKI